MYLKNISINNYGPIDAIKYTFKFDKNGSPSPLILIGKKGCRKTLFLSSIVDMMIEAKKKLYPAGILEVSGKQYYKIGYQSYVKSGTNTALTKIEYGITAAQNIVYLDVLSRNPEEAISQNKTIEQEAAFDQKFRESGFYKKISFNNISTQDFERSIRLFFPFDRYYKPMWYNSAKYNKVPISSENYLGFSTTNMIKIDILDNIKPWLRDVYLQSHSIMVTVPNSEDIPVVLRGKSLYLPQDSKLQRQLNSIISIIKNNNYKISHPTRNSKSIGFEGNGMYCVDISQLSAGEAYLFAFAAAIIREWDFFYGNNEMELSEITGCVIMDEADSNLHIDFAYRALPKLMKLFPKIQFVLSTHSPFLLSGLKKEYGENIDFLSLPDGTLIHDLNSFSEITKAYEVFNLETDNLLHQFASLNAEYQRIKSMNNKVIIYTEGKTDIKYLRLAFEKLSGYEDIVQRIEYYDNEYAQKTGDGELEKIFDYLQKGDDSNIKICMFDRDNKTYILSEPFLRGNNRVYKFNLRTPKHRTETDLISVEHCFTDKELKTTDANGRRIFLAGEFNQGARITADQQYVCHHRIGSNPLEILDGSNDKKVYKISSSDELNCALTKNDFLQHIINNDPGFDKFSFEGFRPTLDVIKAIIKDAEMH